MRSTATVSGQTQDFARGDGSAWLFDAEHLVSNNHVVEDLVDPIDVQFPGGSATRALVVGRDPLTDLAVLRVDAQAVPPLAVCDRPARLGELCFAFGSPLRGVPREYEHRHRQWIEAQSPHR